MKCVSGFWASTHYISQGKKVQFRSRIIQKPQLPPSAINEGSAFFSLYFCTLGRLHNYNKRRFIMDHV